MKRLTIGSMVNVYDWEFPQLRDRRYHGKPAWAREKIAMTQVEPITLELAQPVEGDTFYRDFIMEHGEGLHHLSFEVGNMEEVNKALECFPSLQSAHGGPPGNEQAWAYNYFDIKPLHCIWEPVWLGGGPIGEPIQYPEIDE